MIRQNRLAALCAGVSVLALATHVGLGGLSRSTVEASLRTIPGLSHGPVSVDTLSGRVSVADLAVEGVSGSRLHVGRVVLPTPYALVTPALAAGDVTFEGVGATFGTVTLAIPSVTVAGTSSSRDDLAATFDMQSSKPLGERLAGLTAASVSMPSLSIDMTLPEGHSRTVYKDVRISGINAGVIRSMASSGGTMDASGKGDEMRGSYGPVTVSDLDLPLLAQVYLGGGTPGGEMRVAQGSATAESIAIGTKGPQGNVAWTIGRLSMKSMRMRPTAQPLVPLLQDFSGKAGPSLSEEDGKRLIGGVVEFYDNIALDGVELSDIGVEGPSGLGHGKIGRVAFTGAQVGKPNEMRVEAIEFTGNDGSVRLGSFSHSGWSYAPTLKALRAAVAQPGPLKDSLDPRSLIPEIGTLAVRDLEVDVPDTKARASDPKAPNLRLGLKGLEFSATDPLQGLPTALRLSTDRLTMAIPPGEKDESLKQVAALGYRDLDLSSTIDARWSDASGELSLNQLSFQGVNMGNVSLRGVVGNIPRDVFTGDTTTAQIALLGATVKQATLTVENKGLFERALEAQAKGTHKTPDQLRKELAATAQLGIPAMLGNSGSAKQIAQAVARFVAKPNRLTIAAKSRDPAGLGLADLGAAGGDPRAILDALTVTATAE